jgi:hypothetical protein
VQEEADLHGHGMDHAQAKHSESARDGTSAHIIPLTFM